jgi:hypothetical protein
LFVGFKINNSVIAYLLRNRFFVDRYFLGSRASLCCQNNQKSLIRFPETDNRQSCSILPKVASKSADEPQTERGVLQNPRGDETRCGDCQPGFFFALIPTITRLKTNI